MRRGHDEAGPSLIVDHGPDHGPTFDPHLSTNPMFNPNPNLLVVSLIHLPTLSLPLQALESLPEIQDKEQAARNAQRVVELEGQLRAKSEEEEALHEKVACPTKSLSSSIQTPLQ